MKMFTDAEQISFDIQFATDDLTMLIQNEDWGKALFLIEDIQRELKTLRETVEEKV